MLSLQDVPLAEVTAVCEAAEQKLRSINIAEALQMTDGQVEATMQLRSEYLSRCLVAAHGDFLDRFRTATSVCCVLGGGGFGAGDARSSSASIMP